jgi:hypothetical protein
MFVQVIQGQVSDTAKMRAQLDKWVAEFAPGAEGWLGSTSGVTDDGTFVSLARFESPEAARQNSERPEQGEWWDETAGVPRQHDGRGRHARRPRQSRFRTGDAGPVERPGPRP